MLEMRSYQNRRRQQHLALSHITLERGCIRGRLRAALVGRRKLLRAPLALRLRQIKQSALSKPAMYTGSEASESRLPACMHASLLPTGVGEL